MNIFYIKSKNKPSDGDLKIYKNGKKMIRISKIHNYTKKPFFAWVDYENIDAFYFRNKIKSGNVKFMDASFPQNEKNLSFDFK